MQLSRHDTRALAVPALILCTALLAHECGDYFLRSVRDVEAVGHKPTVISEFGAHVPVAQSFSLLRDGLHSMTVAITSDQDAVIAFEFSLIRKGQLPDWPDEPINKRLVQMSLPAGVTHETIEFPAVSRSKDRTFVATLTLTDVMRRGSSAPDPQVGLSAWLDDAFRGGALKVGTDDRWGDLAFSAQADPPTRVRRASDALAASLGDRAFLRPAALIVLGMTYAVLLLVLCALGFRTWGGLTAWQHGVADIIRNDADQPSAWRLTRTAATLTVTVGAAVLLIAILVTRQRVAVDLLDELDSARFESPNGMHGGFSRIDEVINGVSPQTLFAHPPSRVTWKVAVPSQAPVFRTSVALRPYVWEHRTDGVGFEIVVSDGRHETTLSRDLDPGYRMNDRAWVNLDLDLSEYAGRTVDLSLSTTPGPRGGLAFDWALWGDPRVVSLRWFDRYNRAMRDLNRTRSGV